MTGPQLIMFWRDNNDKRARLSFWLPDGESVAQSVARANALRSALVPLTNARLEGARLSYDDIVEPVGSPAGDSDTRRNLVLILNDGAGPATVRLPSPRLDLPYDASGEWAGIRISAASWAAWPGAVTWLSALGLVVFPWGDPYPTTVSVAGIDFIVP